MINCCKKKGSLLFIVGLSLLGASACSTVDSFMDTSNRINYQNNKAVKVLDFPPDLTAPEYDMAFTIPVDGVVRASNINNLTNSYTVDGRQISVLPKSTKIKSGRIGNIHWIDVNTPAEKLWPKLREFWRSVGIAVKRDEPRIGIMETEWAENRAGLPMDWFRKALNSALQGAFDAGTRDRYRIRVEKPTDQTTRVFLTHKGAEKIVNGSAAGWELRPANHELEAELLNRLKAFLQGDGNAAKSSLVTSSATPSSSLASLVTQEGHKVLQVHDNYKRAWVLTGVMLDRIGLVVEKRNQAAGIYVVTYRGDDQDTVKRGFFSRIFGGRKTILIKGQEYQVHVQDAGKLSNVRITDEEGKPLADKQATQVLSRLKKEFDR